MIVNKVLKLVAITLLLFVGITFAKNNPNREDESKENSIGLMARSARQFVSSLLPTDWEQSNLITNIAIPALFVLFVSSVANSSSKSSASIANNASRKKRSPISGWADNLQRILNNFQKAVEKMQKFEEELENEISEDSVESIEVE